jgi:hypothetical protein
MSEVSYTPEELAVFDQLLDAVGSYDQVTRINGRLDMHAFVNLHGKEKCDAMFFQLEGKKPE